MFVMLYACWFQSGREEAQRSSLSRKTLIPAKYLSACPAALVVMLACCERHTLPVPGVPAMGVVQTSPFSPSFQSMLPSASPFQVLPHSTSVAQRQKPWSHFCEMQSVPVWQRTPLKILSTKPSLRGSLGSLGMRGSAVSLDPSDPRRDG